MLNIEKDYSGMTVNERLFAAGLLDAYKAAVADQNDAKISSILAQVGLRRDPNGAHWPLSKQEI